MASRSKRFAFHCPRCRERILGSVARVVIDKRLVCADCLYRDECGYPEPAPGELEAPMAEQWGLFDQNAYLRP
jgi:hypothetical protein